jgi:hypothetical protein
VLFKGLRLHVRVTYLVGNGHNAHGGGEHSCGPGEQNY